MKFDIDLDDIFAENGETLAESVKRHVVENLTASIGKNLTRQIDEETSRILGEELRKAVAERMSDIVADIMNSEYVPTGSFGQRGEKTTFRNELVKAVAAQAVYKPQNYERDENAFTNAVRGVVGEQMAAFKKEFTSKIDDSFKRDALAYAVKTLAEKLGLSPKG